MTMLLYQFALLGDYISIYFKNVSILESILHTFFSEEGPIFTFRIT